MKGAKTLYNTYWVRFKYGEITFERAVENSKTLINAAIDAGIERIVHISITNPDENSPFPYFKGKAIIEKAIMDSKLSYAIIRPTVIFGGDVSTLINNIAWLLRRFPIFAIPGNGNYKLQPIFIGDLVDLAVKTSFKRENIILDAVGPEIFTYNELVRFVANAIGRKVKFFYVKPEPVLFLANIIGYFVGDVLITKDEIYGLMSNLLVSEKLPTGKTALSKWLEDNVSIIGKNYISEIKRHYIWFI